MGISADAFLFYGFFFSLDRHDENTDAWLEKRLPEGIKFEVLDFDFGNDFFAYVEGRYYLAHADRRVRIDPDVLGGNTVQDNNLIVFAKNIGVSIDSIGWHLCSRLG